MSNEPTNKLSERIGIPALLDMVAEEAVELSHAAIKLSRYYRDENPVVGHSFPDLKMNLNEEIADMYVVLREAMKEKELTDYDVVSKVIDEKRKRMNKRLGMKAEEFIF